LLHYKPALARAGISDRRLYDLRHTYVTNLLLAGESVKVVSETLGHASSQITLDTYSHVIPELRERARATIEASFFSSVSD